MGYKTSNKIITLITVIALLGSFVVYSSAQIQSSSTVIFSATVLATTSNTIVPFGGGVYYNGFTEISGYSAPYSIVTIIMDNKTLATVTASYDGSFVYRTPEKLSGEHVFGFYMVDIDGNVSRSISTAVDIKENSYTTIKDVYLAPTFYNVQTAVKVGEDVIITGNGVVGDTVFVEASYGGVLYKYSVIIGNTGGYRIEIPTSILMVPTVNLRTYSTLARSSSTILHNSNISINIGLETVNNDKPNSTLFNRCDIKKDMRVNLADFSIMSYWYKQNSSFPAEVDLNQDNKLDLEDFSILAFCWTG